MRLTALGVIVALGAIACGEKKADQAQAAQTATTQTTATQPAAAPTGPVVEVKMTGNGTNLAAFVPKTLQIAPGTTVRFVNVSGGPHNVAFYADSIPAGAAALLDGQPVQPVPDQPQRSLRRDVRRWRSQGRVQRLLPAARGARDEDRDHREVTAAPRVDDGPGEDSGAV